MEWKYIKGYNKRYKICEDGEVIISSTGKILKPVIRNTHRSVSLFRDGKYKSFLIYKLQKEYFDIEQEPLERVESLDGEIWKPIVGYERLYSVSNKGRVKSHGIGIKKRERIIKMRKNKKGILDFSISKNDIRENMLLHREMAKAFIPNPHKKKLTVHLNGDKLDNRLENIVWFTDSENQRNARKLGLVVTPKGKDSTCSLKVNQYELGGIHIIKTWDCITDVERELGIFRSNIVKVCKGKRNSAGGYFWSYVDEGE